MDVVNLSLSLVQVLTCLTDTGTVVLPRLLLLFIAVLMGPLRLATVALHSDTS